MDLDIRRVLRDLPPGQSAGITWKRREQMLGVVQVELHGDGAAVTLRSYCRSNAKDSQPCTQVIQLTSTRSTFGLRNWFVCPECKRRCAIVYGGPTFACRRCLVLVYPSSRENPSDRARRKAQNIRAKLGGSLSLMDEFPDKPLRMHWRTYDRLAAQAAAAEGKLWGWAAKRFGIQPHRHV